jgi:hypothetical protein
LAQEYFTTYVTIFHKQSKFIHPSFGAGIVSLLGAAVPKPELQNKKYNTYYMA